MCRVPPGSARWTLRLSICVATETGSAVQAAVLPCAGRKLGLAIRSFRSGMLTT